MTRPLYDYELWQSPYGLVEAKLHGSASEYIRVIMEHNDNTLVKMLRREEHGLLKMSRRDQFLFALQLFLDKHDIKPIGICAAKIRRGYAFILVMPAGETFYEP
jgi:hypothetical protein